MSPSERSFSGEKSAARAPKAKRATGKRAESSPAGKRAESSPAGKRAERSAAGKRAERSPADKRERILRAAIRVFARKGFYATRVSEIAKAAGVADGTIYLYFKNKDDVLVSVFEDRITKLLAVLQTEVERDAPFDVKFTRVVELQLGLLEGQRDLAEVVTVNLRQSTKLLKQYATPLFIRYLDLIAGLVAEGQEAGVVREDVSPRVLARSLWGALDGVALTWALGGAEPGQLGRAAMQVCSVFLDGLRARR